MKNIGSTKKIYFFVYTIAFLVVALLVYSSVIVTGKTLIWQGDGFNQHYKSLLFYSKYIRSVLSGLFSGKGLHAPQWGYSLGEGSDILFALHYYCFGDPIAAFSALVKERYIHIFYSVSSVLRLYLAGLGLSFLCFEAGVKNKTGILVSAISYSFCYFGIQNTARHPFFLNAMIFLPLLIIGIERGLKGKRPFLYILMVMLSAISNFYFFYILIILTAVYGVVRVAYLDKSARDKLAIIGRFFLYTVVGCCLSGAVLLPVVMNILSDARVSVSEPWPILYAINYYLMLPKIIIGPYMDYRLRIGLAVPVIVAIMFFLVSKKKGFLRALLVICTLFVLFPVFGRVFNGTKYISNRWCFAMALLGTFILAKYWEELFAEAGKYKIQLVACAAALMAMAWLLRKSILNRTLLVGASIIMVMTLVMFICDRISSGRRQLAVAGLTMVSVTLIAYCKFSPRQMNFIGEMVDVSTAYEKVMDNGTVLLNGLDGDADEWKYIKYSGNYVKDNENILSDYACTSYYFSLTNKNNFEFMNELEEREYLIDQHAYSFDDRSVLLALAGVDYYISRPGYKTVPSGFELVDSGTNNNGDYEIYKNRNTLPTGYCYDSYVDSGLWDQLDVAQKNQIQLDTAYIRDNNGKLAVSYYDKDAGNYEVPVETRNETDSIYVTESGVVATEGNLSVKVSFSSPEDSEIYISLEGLDFRETSAYDLYFSDEADPEDKYDRDDWERIPLKQRMIILRDHYSDYPFYSATIKFKLGNRSKNVKYHSAGDPGTYNGRHDFLVNLGRLEDGRKEVSISFDKRGIYKINSIKVYCVPMAGFEEKIEKLGECCLEDMELKNDRIIGTVDAPSNKILCMTIPFSEGWKVFVDGTPAELLNVNIRYMGVEIPKGHHEVVFEYNRPYQRLGDLVSLLGLLMLLGVMLI